MQAQLTLVGMMELATAGKEGSGAYVLNYLGGSVYLAKDVIQGTPKTGEVKECVMTGELRRAEFGVNFQPKKAAIK